MKKLILFLMILISASVFGQDAKKEVFDLSDDVLTENEKNFLDFYNNHWKEEGPAVKKILSEVSSFLTDKEIKHSEIPASDLRELFELDDFILVSRFWENGFVFNFSTACYFCFVSVFDAECNDEIFFDTCKIIKQNWQDVDFVVDWAPYPLDTKNYKKFY